MTPEELRANAIKFLGHMMTRPEVLEEVQKCPAGAGQGKDPNKLGPIMAKHLGIAQLTVDEVRAMGKHIQEATAKVKEVLTEHAPAQATTFSPSHFIFD